MIKRIIGFIILSFIWSNYFFGQIIASGGYHTLTICNNGSVMAWGVNQDGELGLGDTTHRSIPTPIPGLLGIVAVAGGPDHSLALKNDGSVWAWGNNSYGQLGDGTTVGKLSPIQVPGLTNVKAISSGAIGNYSMVLKNDSTVWEWGYGFGNTPAQVMELNGIVAISEGSMALKADGTVWTRYAGCAGTYSVFTKVPGASNIGYLTNIVGIVESAGSFLALKGDSTVWAWGQNSYGQLGIGNISDTCAPIQVGITGVKAIAMGAYHSLFIKGNGTVWGCGYNYYGQVGCTCTTQNQSTPKETIYITSGNNNINNIIEIAAGYQSSLALKNNDTLWAWGGNQWGQLGNGTEGWGCTAVLGLCNLTDISKQVDDNISLIGFPNPTNNSVTINVKFLDNNLSFSKLIIYDAFGNKIFEKQNIESNIKIETQNWDQGIYFFKLINNNTSSCQILKVVVIH